MTVTLDWLRTKVRPPSVLKIDVEGAEVEVLRGGVTLLSRDRPTVICEVKARNESEVQRLLNVAGYSVLSSSGGNIVAIPSDPSGVGLARE